MRQNTKPLPHVILTPFINNIVRYLIMIMLSLLLFGLILLLSGKDAIQSYRDIFASTLGSADFTKSCLPCVPCSFQHWQLRCPRELA
jgi:ABC-type uncharacterized transport system permease subunit